MRDENWGLLRWDQLLTSSCFMIALIEMHITMFWVYVQLFSCYCICTVRKNYDKYSRVLSVVVHIHNLWHFCLYCALNFYWKLPESVYLHHTRILNVLLLSWHPSNWYKQVGCTKRKANRSFTNPHFSSHRWHLAKHVKNSSPTYYWRGHLNVSVKPRFGQGELWRNKMLRFRSITWVIF